MSVADPTTELARTATETLPAVRTPIAVLIACLVPVVRGLAFWVATLLPLAYLPLLAVGVVAEHPVGFLGVAGANAVAFVVGHAYDPVL
jgi:hypothetical protein